MEHLRITVEGKVYDVIVEKIDTDDSEHAPTHASAIRTSAPAAAQKLSTPQPTPAASAGAGEATSPLAGIVQAIEVAVGASVNEGDLVVTLEAMKMFTPLNAPATGTIKAIHVKVGDSVEEGQVLYTIS